MGRAAIGISVLLKDCVSAIAIVLQPGGDVVGISVKDLAAFGIVGARRIGDFREEGGQGGRLVEVYPVAVRPAITIDGAGHGQAGDIAEYAFIEAQAFAFELADIAHVLAIVRADSFVDASVQLILGKVKAHLKPVYHGYSS